LSTNVIVIDPTRCAGPLLPAGVGITAGPVGIVDAEAVAEGDPITFVAGDEQAAPSIAITIDMDAVVRRVIEVLVQRA
jgi:hypothetical protein